MSLVELRPPRAQDDVSHGFLVALGIAGAFAWGFVIGQLAAIVR